MFDILMATTMKIRPKQVQQTRIVLQAHLVIISTPKHFVIRFVCLRLYMDKEDQSDRYTFCYSG